MVEREWKGENGGLTEKKIEEKSDEQLYGRWVGDEGDVRALREICII